MFLYETHLHTSEVSRCARANAEEQLTYYKSLGYAGVFVTDHFINGNSIVPHDIPYAERIEQFCIGYEKAKSLEKKYGIDVFFGFEYSYEGTDFLIYGADKSWLLENADAYRLPVYEYLDYARSKGALVIHAHPIREANYIKMIRLLPRNVDGVEAPNACRTEFENLMGKKYAEDYGLLNFAGSDNHVADKLRHLAGIASETRFNDVSDMIEAVRARRVLRFELDVSEDGKPDVKYING